MALDFFRAEAGKTYKSKVSGATAYFTPDQLRDPSAGFIPADYELQATGATQSPSSPQDVSGVGVRSVPLPDFSKMTETQKQTFAQKEAPVAPQPPAKEVNVITSQQAQGKIDSLPPLSPDDIKKSALDYEYQQLREKAKKRADEEAALKLSLQGVKAAEATNEFLEGQKSQRAADFKLGRSGTYYQENALDKAKQDFDRQQYRFQIEDQLISNQIRDAWENNDTRLARELQTKKDSMDEKRRQDRKDAEDTYFKRMNLANDLEDQSYKFFEKAAKSGREFDDDELAFVENRYKLDPGMGRVVFEAFKSEEDSKKTKEDLDRMVQKVQLQTGLINLQNLPEKTRLEMAKMVEDLGASSVRTANSIFEAMKNQPVGVPLVLPDATYLGVPGAGVVERSSDGTSVLSWKDSQGRIKTQEFSFMPDPKDSEQIYLNGVPALRDKKSGTVYPITDGPDVTNRNAGWTKFFPVGSRGGQCGEYCHRFVEDYPYGLNTLEEKKSAMNVRKGEKYQVGDILVQNIGGWTGHVSVVDWTGTDENGEQIVTVNESNLKNDERITAGRPLKASDPTIEGAFRGKLRPQFITGSDRPSAPEPTAQLQADTRSFDQGIETYGLKIPKASPFIVGPQTSTQYQDSLQNELAARSAAAQLVGGDITDTKDIDQKVRTRALEIASANGYTKPGTINTFKPKPFNDFLMEYAETSGQSVSTPALYTEAKKAYEQDQKDRSYLERASKNLIANISNKEIKESAREEVSGFLNNDDREGLVRFIESSVRNNLMKQKQQEAYDSFTANANVFESLGNNFDSVYAEVSSGPYKNIIEQNKPYAALPRDQRYVDLQSTIGQRQAEYRNQLFGASLTPNEQAVANEFLVDFKKDSMDVIKRKLNNIVGMSNFINDLQISLSLGIERPDYNEYVQTK